jgi:hypothetical protein
MQSGCLLARQFTFPNRLRRWGLCSAALLALVLHIKEDGSEPTGGWPGGWFGGASATVQPRGMGSRLLEHAIEDLHPEDGNGPPASSVTTRPAQATRPALPHGGACDTGGGAGAPIREFQFCSGVGLRHAEDHLWVDVLNLRGYNVLPEPFRKEEVIRLVSLAWRHRKSRAQSSARAAGPGVITRL